LGISCIPLSSATVNRLNSTLDQATSLALLVLDDYQVITTPTLHRALRFLVEHLEHLHLVLATRADPPLRLARLRGRGQLLELRDTDLRFTTQNATVNSTQVAFIRRPTCYTPAQSIH